MRGLLWSSRVGLKLRSQRDPGFEDRAYRAPTEWQSIVTGIMAESAAKALQVLDALLAGSTHGRARKKDDNDQVESLDFLSRQGSNSR